MYRIGYTTAFNQLKFKQLKSVKEYSIILLYSLSDTLAILFTLVIINKFKFSYNYY